MPIPPSPRSGRIWIERQIEQRAVRELGWADSGLLHRVWMDVAHRPRIVRLAAGEVRLGAWQALVSVSEYAREAGCTRKCVRAGLSRLAEAGWVDLAGGPHGVVVGCLIRPSGEVPEASADAPVEAGGGGPPGTRGVVPQGPPQYILLQELPLQNTPQQDRRAALRVGVLIRSLRARAIML